MIGTAKNPDGDEILMLAGHSAGGPGSVGAAYGDVATEMGRTVAVFIAGSNGGSAEIEAIRKMVRMF